MKPNLPLAAMKKRIILYKKGFRYELALEEGKTATVSNQETAQLTLASQENPLHFQWSQGEIFYQYGEDKGVLENSKILGDVVCYLATGEVHTYELLDKEEILVADEKSADVRLHYPVRFLLVKKEQTWSYLENSTITINSSVKRLFHWPLGMSLPLEM